MSKRDGSCEFPLHIVLVHVGEFLANLLIGPAAFISLYMIVTVSLRKDTSRTFRSALFSNQAGYDYYTVCAVSNAGPPHVSFSLSEGVDVTVAFDHHLEVVSGRR
jgi:hypothetical protein